MLRPRLLRPLRLAATTCQFLADTVPATDTPDCPRVWYTFALLGRMIEALSPTDADLSEVCYLRNRWRSSVELFRGAERKAAGYQLREMARKLSRLDERGE